METPIKRKKNSRKLKKWHKWVGLVFTFFLFMFAASGIFLNYRQSISTWDISRSILWEHYRYDNWNNGSARGTFVLSPDSILLYGNNGVWLTDSLHTAFSPFDAGFGRGADNRTVSRMARTPDGRVFAAAMFSVYELDAAEGRWIDISHRVGCRERVSDIESGGDTLVVTGRSHIYVSGAPYDAFEKRELPQPEGYVKKTTWFRTMWTLHSGEIFGVPGQTVVTAIGIFTIVLCVTGVILTFSPGALRRKKRAGKSTAVDTSLFRGSLRWHNKLGSWFLILFLLVAVTGIFLRPPLMIAVIRSQTKPLPGSTLDSPNPWHDKLRCIRYDSHNRDWIVYSSVGFYTASSLGEPPRRLMKPPPVSVMGVTVLEQADSANWIAGSFSGIYRWNRETGTSLDLFTGEPYQRGGGMPLFSNTVSGYSGDFAGKEVVFDYSSGARTVAAGDRFAPMPGAFGDGRMSFWNLCLEIHVGRIYAPLWGNLVSALFIPLSGLLFVLIVLTGYIVYRRHHRRKRRSEN